MRKRNFIRLAMATLLAAITFQSCDTDNDYDWEKAYPNALVTVKQNGDDTYLQLDDNTTLLAQNIKKPIFDGKEVRAMVNYSTTQEKNYKYNQVVYVNWIDSILTKKPVPSLATTEENAQKYGNDMVDIVRNWLVIEDGYLTLRFRALWGGQKVHYINLVSGVNPDNPYEVELRHNANGDPQLRWGDALVAFNLNNVLPDTQGKTVKLKIHWKSSEGDKTMEFDYCSRKSISSTSILEGYSQSAISSMK